jgi:hypothetical protein
MTDKCYKCLFADEEQYMTTTIPVCIREADYIESVKAREDKEICPWHITMKQIIEMQDRGLL